MIMRRSAIAGMLVACCVGAPAFSIVRAQAVPYTHTVQTVRANRAATNLSVQTVSHGIRLTLMLPKRVFGADEIAWMTVRIQNLSRRSLVPDVSCDMQNPRVEVRARSGFILYPPAVVFLTVPTCRLPRVAPLRPGSTLVTHRYVIVRARYLRAAVLLAPERAVSHGLGPGPSFLVRTPSIQVTLVPRDKPAVQLCSYSHLCANVEPPFLPAGSRLHGPLLYAFTARCGSPQTPRYAQSVWLQAAPRNTVFTPPRYRIYPGCAQPNDWNFVVGWVGTPVTHIHYVRR